MCDATRIGETRDTIGVLYEQGGCSLVLGMVEAADVLAHGRVPPPPPPPPPVRPGPVISPGLSRVEVKLAMQHRAALVPCYAFGTVDLHDLDRADHIDLVDS